MMKEIERMLEEYFKSDRYSNYDGIDMPDLAKAIEQYIKENYVRKDMGSVTPNKGRHRENSGDY